MGGGRRVGRGWEEGGGRGGDGRRDERREEGWEGLVASIAVMNL